MYCFFQAILLYRVLALTLVKTLNQGKKRNGRSDILHIDVIGDHSNILVVVKNLIVSVSRSI